MRLAISEVWASVHGSTKVVLGPVEPYLSADATGQAAAMLLPLAGSSTTVTRGLLSVQAGVAFNVGPVTMFVAGGPTWNGGHGVYNDLERVCAASPYSGGPTTTDVQAFAWMVGGGFRFRRPPAEP